jgi:hypothetical protein
MNYLYALKNLVAPPTPLYCVLVIAHNSDGTSLVQFPGGAQITVRGQTVAVGSQAFIQGGEIRQQAPELDEITIDV